MVPFPWSVKASAGQDGWPRREATSTAATSDKNLYEVRRSTVLLDPSIKSIRDKLFPAESLHDESSQRLLELYLRCLETGCIGFSLPPLGALAGRVLRHAVSEIEKLFAKHEPLIWKVGYTHNAFWRWSNKLYGYAKAVDKWERLQVLYIACEPFSPAMLEAALIEKFQSPLTANLFLLSRWVMFPVFIVIETLSPNLCFSAREIKQGKQQGCRNVRAGGDTVPTSRTDENDRFMTYIVYRSFKHPPEKRKRSP